MAKRSSKPAFRSNGLGLGFERADAFDPEVNTADKADCSLASDDE